MVIADGSRNNRRNGFVARAKAFGKKKRTINPRRATHPNNDEKNPLDELSFLSASDSRAIAFSSLLDMAGRDDKRTGKQNKKIKPNALFSSTWRRRARYHHTMTGRSVFLVRRFLTETPVGPIDGRDKHGTTEQTERSHDERS